MKTEKMKTDDLINNLCKGDCKVRPMCTWRCGLGWVLFTGLFIYYMLSLCGCREDIFAMLDTHAFRIEMYSAFAAGFIAALSASWFAIPDGKQQHWEYWLVVPPLALFISTLVYEWVNPNAMPMPIFSGHIQMYLHMLAYTIVPGILLFALLKRAASTRLHWISIMSGIAIFCFAHVGIRLGNAISDMDQVFAQIIIPNLLLTAGISVIGHRLLKW